MRNTKKTELNAEEQLIQEHFDALINDYLASNHLKRVERITKAFNFAHQAHKGIKRAGGEPYILHPIAVARIACTEIGLGSTSICAALLHDVVEDTDYTVEDIKNIFGDKIAQLVDGLTKISGGIFADTNSSIQTENFRKLFLTMNDDIRVILIKMADRLHNMRTLGALPPNKQYKIAGETLYIYAPLANRLGLNKIKSELEDLSFRYEHPDEYDIIVEELKAGEKKRNEVFTIFADPIRSALNEMGFEYTISQRIKSIYSIWKKMQTKHIPFSEIYDLMAVRIVFKPKENQPESRQCLDIYDSIASIYRYHPDRFRDWVNSPKSNGYEALHATFMSKGEWIEVQIRSERMHEVAEKGFAAHWKYKGASASADDTSEGDLDKWLKRIKDVLDNPDPDKTDLLDDIKLNLSDSDIFVFTPKGELRTIPQDSTALDFAFHIHTLVGVHCIGAKVNHKLVPLSYKLQSGDQVEILTSKSKRIQESWLKFITTSHAKGKIRTFLKLEAREYEKQGYEMLNTFLREENILSDEQTLSKLCELHQLETKEQLYTAIGNGNIKLGEDEINLLSDKSTNRSWKNLFGLNRITSKEKDENILSKDLDTKKILNLTDEMIHRGVEMAPCCNPIPGDDVVGYINEQEKLIIHKRQCQTAIRLKSSFGNRIIAVKWNTHKKHPFSVPIYLKGIDGKGVLNQITQVISTNQDIDIRSIHIETNAQVFEAKLRIEVYHLKEVKQLLSALSKIKSVKECIRMENNYTK